MPSISSPQEAVIPLVGNEDELPEGLGSYLGRGPRRRAERNGAAEQAMWGGSR